MVIHCEAIKPYVKPEYTREDCENLLNFLTSAGVFEFPTLSNGLFPAAVALNSDDEYTGYHNCWVRDNIHIAHMHYVIGDYETVIACLNSLTAFFQKYQHRFDDIIEGRVAADDLMNRPHIRFNGEELKENSEQWAHLQNDALGYYVWLTAMMVLDQHIPWTAKLNAVMTRFVQFFSAIEYWSFEDHGHWEETPKIEASSIGVVVAAMRELLKVLEKYEPKWEQKANIELMQCKGQTALEEILPAECIQEDPEQNREVDAALLFLIYPLNVTTPEQTESILKNVADRLTGSIGICRYRGDSYWCADYKTKLNQEQRTSDFSEDLSDRNSLLQEGEEAEWCIFDSIISCIYATQYQAAPSAELRSRQISALHRTLGQLTAETSRYGALKLSESYFLEKGTRVPNDICPLLWSHANLRLALHWLLETTAKS